MVVGLGRFAVASVAGFAGEEGFEAFDVRAPNVGNVADLGVVFDEVDSEMAQGGVDQCDTAGPHADRDLGQIPAQSGDQKWGVGAKLLPVDAAA